MSREPKSNADQEAVLIALDQLSQTMDVMSQVVARLKRTVEQAQFADPTGEQAVTESTREALDQQYQQRKRAMTKAQPEKSKKKATVETPIIIH